MAATAEAAEEEAAERMAMIPGAARHPVQFVRLDPGGAWLAGVTVLQPELAWVAQLERSGDVVAQSLAVTGGCLAGCRTESEPVAHSCNSTCIRYC